MNRRSFFRFAKSLGILAILPKGAAVASNFPASLDTTATLPAVGGVGANLSTFPHSTLHGNANDAIIAIETELGVAPSGAETTVKARLDRITPTLGALTSWTPAVTQSGVVTCTNVKSTWQRTGRQLTLRFQLTVTGTGTASNAVVISGFGTTVGSHPTVVGQAMLVDNSSGTKYPAIMTLASTTTVELTSSAANIADGRLGVSQFTAALAVNDTLSGTFILELVGD
jgi:hypothetical protein